MRRDYCQDAVCIHGYGDPEGLEHLSVLPDVNASEQHPFRLLARSIFPFRQPRYPRKTQWAERNHLPVTWRAPSGDTLLRLCL